MLILRVQVHFQLCIYLLQGLYQPVFIFYFSCLYRFYCFLYTEELLCYSALIFHPLIILAVVLRYLAQVAGAARRNDVYLLAHLVRHLVFRVQRSTRLICHQVHQLLVHSVSPRIVELGSYGAIYRHILGFLIKQFMIALVLLLHIAQGIYSTALVKLVDHHYIGEVQHVYFLQLAGRTKFGRHHVKAEVAMPGDLGIALAYA